MLQQKWRSENGTILRQVLNAGGDLDAIMDMSANNNTRLRRELHKSDKSQKY